MGISTGIEYVHSTVNAIRGCGGCELWKPNSVNPVKICYAGQFISRYKGTKAWPEDFNKPQFYADAIPTALTWPQILSSDRSVEKPWLRSYPRIIFVNDMSDGWTEFFWVDGVKTDAPIDWLDRYWDDMIKSPHIWLMLTKRPLRMVKYFVSKGMVPSNFWLGVSVTGAETVSRLQHLKALYPYKQKNSVLWASFEPLLTNPGLNQERLTDGLKTLDWAVIGGESGQQAKARPYEFDWYSKMIHACLDAGVSPFVKQLGTASGYGTKGQLIGEWPTELQVRQMP